jgi:hypothetical protein
LLIIQINHITKFGKGLQAHANTQIRCFCTLPNWREGGVLVEGQVATGSASFASLASWVHPLQSQKKHVLGKAKAASQHAAASSSHAQYEGTQHKTTADRMRQNLQESTVAAERLGGEH